MRRVITVIAAGLAAAMWLTSVQADATVMAVRLGAKDAAALAKFYETAFGLKEIDRVGNPAREVIMRFGATAAAAKSGTSPEFLVQTREAGAAADSVTHAIFHVSDIAAAVAAAKAAGATVKADVKANRIGQMPIKEATLVDPDGNQLELMELPKGADHIQHP